MVDVFGQFKKAIDQLLLVEVSFFSRDDNKVITRKCVPLDFGPSRRSASNAKKYHFLDLQSDSQPGHPLPLLPDQITVLKVLDEHFKPTNYITWKFEKGSWFLPRDWGQFS